MVKTIKMERLQKIVIIAVVVLLLLIGAILFSFFRWNILQKQLIVLSENRYTSEKITDELRQSSDDLTRLARTYVVTGDTFYRDQFFEVLKIRRGESPRPKYYSRPYWDLIGVPDDKAPRERTYNISFKDLIRKAGFTNEELSILEKVEQLSDSLALLEIQAFNAVDGDTSISKPDQKLAIDLLFGRKYHKAKAAIMQELDNFYNISDLRTYKEVVDQNTKIQYIIFLIAVLFILSITILGFHFYYNYKLKSFIINDLNQKVAQRTIELLQKTEEIATQNEEFAQLNEELNQTNNSLLDSQKIIQNEKNRFEQLFKINPDAVTITQISDGKIVEANEGFIKLFGYALDEVIGKTTLELNIWTNPEERLRFITELTEKFSSSNFETLLCRKDGSTFTALVSTSIIKINDILHIIGVTRDISDRKIIEQKNIEREKKFRLLFENMTSGFQLNEVIVDENNTPIDIKFLEGNSRIKEYLGFSIDEIRGKTMKQILPQADSYMIRKFGSVALTGEPFNIEYFSYTFNKYLRVNTYSPQKGQIASIFEDITERKKAEELLQMQENFLRTLTDNIPGMVAYWTKDLVCGFPNSNYLEWFGKTEQEMIGITMMEMMGETLFAKNKPFIDKALSGEKIDFERTLIKANGETGHTWAHYIPDIKDGDVIGFYVLVSDITELKLVQEALLQERTLLEKIMKTSPVGIITCDSKGFVTYANSRGVQILGLTKETITQRTYNAPNWKISDVDGNAFPDHELPFIVVMTTKKPCFNVQHAIENAEGVRTILSINAAPLLNEKDDFEGMIASIEDITIQKKSDIKIQQQNEKLTELNATKDKFFSIIAHDLKSPFNSILGFCELLISDIDSYDKEVIKEYVSYIDTTANQTYKLLENLLLWSRIQRGLAIPDLQAINLKSIAYSIELLMTNIAMTKKIKLQNNIKSDIYVECDVEMTNTILRNLISNALKFTRPGGSVTMDAQQQNSEIEVRITDTGVGIDGEKIPYLFLIEKNTSTPGTDNESGTALGLPLCKDLVEKQAGKIWVESELGKGSTFCFTLNSSL